MGGVGGVGPIPREQRQDQNPKLIPTGSEKQESRPTPSILLGFWFSPTPPPPPPSPGVCQPLLPADRPGARELPHGALLVQRILAEAGDVVGHRDGLDQAGARAEAGHWGGGVPLRLSTLKLWSFWFSHSVKVRENTYFVPWPRINLN